MPYLRTVEKLYDNPIWRVVRGVFPSDLKMRFSRACTAKTAPIKGWRGERRASESPYSQAKTLEERFRLEACRCIDTLKLPTHKLAACFPLQKRNDLFRTFFGTRAAAYAARMINHRKMIHDLHRADGTIFFTNFAPYASCLAHRLHFGTLFL